MRPMDISDIGSFDVVTVDYHPYMFTNMRVDRDSIPDGFVAYDVRDCDCDGEFAEIRDYVLVNHWGTIIGMDALEMDEYLSYLPDESKCDGWGVGSYVSGCDEFAERYGELLQMCAPDVSGEIVL